MKPVNLMKAITLANEHHSTRLTINHIRHNNEQVSAAIGLVIHSCVPALITKLIDAGFSLSMGVEGLSVCDYAVKS